VRDLVREGDDTPGAYRSTAVRIAKSEHLPPDALMVSSYMQELVSFINQVNPPKYDLIKVALSHHRFGWVHPFGNGNGRVVRLLTYALMIKYGFNVKAGGRVLNPTAVFCVDRDKYYAMLSTADTGASVDLEQWCVYVLQGVLFELQKVDQLTRFDYLVSQILAPALKYARDRSLVSAQEEAVLSIAIKKGVAKAADLSGAMPSLNAAQRTYQIKRLVERRMLQPIVSGSRQYTVGFDNSFLMRGVIHALSEQGFISIPLKGSA
jgi:Fic family protein